MTNLKFIKYIGALDEIITIQQRSISIDNAGQQIESWSDYLTSIFCDIKYGTATEKEDSGRITDFDVLIFFIRYDSGVDQTMRILYDNAVFDILSIKKVGRQRFLEISAKARE